MACWTDGVEDRIRVEQKGDLQFYRQNVANRFCVKPRIPIRPEMRWPFVKRNARRLTAAHHITIENKQYVRLYLSQGGWRGETVLVVVDGIGRVVEYCSSTYNYLASQHYR